MKLTQQQLLEAVRAAGAGRESFTCADVREQLGLSTKDRQQANQFYRAFRTLRANAELEIEKLGSNCYRLRVEQPVIAPELPMELVEADLIEVDRAELSEVAAEAASEAALPAPIVEEHVEPDAGPTLESAALEGAAQPVSTVPAWRGHMLRFGRRVRSLFSGRAPARPEASVGA